MKILMVNDYAQRIAGTEVYIEHITTELIASGHEVKLFASSLTKQQYFSATYNTSVLKKLQRIFNFSNMLAFKKIIENFKPDIIHVHNIYNEISPSIFLAAKNIPIVMTVHDSRIVSPVSIQSERTGKPCKNVICSGCINCVGWKGYLYEILKRNVYAHLFKKVKLYITPSEYLRTILIKKGYTNITQLYNGILLFDYSSIQNTYEVFFAGRLILEKGIDQLINAISLLQQRISLIHLTIAGDGDYKNKLQEKVKQLHLNKCITFVGSVNLLELKKYYKNTTIVVIPSLNPDNLPTVGLEALSVGRPIVGSDIGGISEIVINKKTGILVKPGNTQELAQAIYTLLNHPKMIGKMSKNARKYAQDMFDIKQHIIRLEEIYTRIIFLNI